MSTALGTMLLSAGALAGPLADPTRPPAAMGGAAVVPAGPHRTNADTARAIAAAARAANPPAPPVAIVLQSVQLSAHAPAVAMVDGRLVKAGDQIDGRTVLAIDAQGLLLRPEGHRAAAPQRVWLLDGATKQAPGSIATSLATRYQPSGDGSGAVTGQAAAPAERAPTAGNGRTPAAETSPQSAAPASLSLAGRTAP